MEINIIEPGQTVEVKLEQEIDRITTSILRTIWDFAENHPVTVFALLDFKNNDYESFVGLQRTLIDVENLKDVTAPYTFSQDEKRLESLRNYILSDMDELRQKFIKTDTIVPTRIRLAIFIPKETKRVSIEYVVKSDLPMSLEETKEDWKRRLNSIGIAQLIL